MFETRPAKKLVRPLFNNKNKSGMGYVPEIPTTQETYLGQYRTESSAEQKQETLSGKQLKYKG
jgi:hypothetical protein